MLNKLCAVLLVVLVSVAHADDTKKKEAPGILKMSPIPEMDLSGFYECSGTDQSGKKYNGMCHVVQAGQVHVVSWLTGGASFTGIGLVSVVGEKTVFSVAWAMPKEGQILRGINVYQVSKISGQFHLSGYWATVPGNGQKFRETLKWMKDSTKEDE